jgi:toxin ParE1/3/4
MSRRVLRVRPLATADIDHTAAFLFDENPVAAMSFLDAVETAFGLLVEQPGIGSPRYARLLPGVTLRMWPVQGFPHLIFYLDRAEAVEVLRVLHGARDIPAILLDETDLTGMATVTTPDHETGHIYPPSPPQPSP